MQNAYVQTHSDKIDRNAFLTDSSFILYFFYFKLEFVNILGRYRRS